MRARLWSLLEVQLCRPMQPPERSSWYPKEGLGVLVGTRPRLCEHTRWDNKSQGQQLNWDVIVAAMSIQTQGRGAVSVLTIGLIPCWSEHTGNKFEFKSLSVLEGVKSLPSCPRHPMQGSHEGKLLPIPSMHVGLPPTKMCDRWSPFNTQE